MLLMNEVLLVYRRVGAVDSQFVLLSYFTNISMEAPACHKGGIASRRNYSCETTQLFAS